MRRVTSWVLLGGAAWVLAACSGDAVTAPTGASSRIAASQVAGQAAPLPQGSCQYSDPGTGTYPVVVSWSGMKVTRIDVFDGAGNPLSQTVLGHSGRKGSLSLTENGQPATAEIFGTTIGLKVLCSAG